MADSEANSERLTAAASGGDAKTWKSLQDELLDQVAVLGIGEVTERLGSIPKKWARREQKRFNQLHPRIAATVMSLVNRNGEVSNQQVQKMFLRHDVRGTTDQESEQIAHEQASQLLELLRESGVLWYRGSHYESREALIEAFGTFSYEHIVTNPYDTLLPHADLSKVPMWLGNVIKRQSKRVAQRQRE